MMLMKMLCGPEKRLMIVCAVVCVLVAPRLASGSPVLSEAQVLSLHTLDNRNPSIDATPDGRRVAVVLDGVQAGNRRIFLRESIDGYWLDAAPLDAEPAADNHSAVVRLDSAGSPHVVWIADIRGCDRIFYAFRVGNSWNYWGSVSPYEPDDANMEAVSLKIDSDNRPWVVWQSGRGSNYVIRCAHLDPELGSFEVDTLAPATSNYNLYPEIFFAPEPTVYWYSAQNADFALTASRLDVATGVWSAMDVSDLDRMPTNRLPSFVHSAGRLTATWYDELDSMDRVFVGTQDPLTRGAGRVVDHRANANNHLVSASIAGETLAIAWCSESRNSGSQVYLLWGRQPGELEDEIRVSDKVPGYCSHPRVSLAESGAAVVWESSLANGGTGNILFRRVRF